MRLALKDGSLTSFNEIYPETSTKLEDQTIVRLCGLCSVDTVVAQAIDNNISLKDILGSGVKLENVTNALNKLTPALMSTSVLSSKLDLSLGQVNTGRQPFGNNLGKRPRDSSDDSFMVTEEDKGVSYKDMEAIMGKFSKKMMQGIKEEFDTQLTSINATITNIQTTANSAKTLAEQCNTNVENNLKSFRDELEELKEGSSSKASSSDVLEYIRMLQRQEVTRNATLAVVKRVEFITTREIIVNELVDEGAGEQQNDKYVISLEKLTRYINTSLGLNYPENVRKPAIVGRFKRGQKFVFVLEFGSPRECNSVISNRRRFKVDQDSRKNSSISKPLNLSMQKLHSLLTDLKQQKKVTGLDITRKGNLNVNVFNAFRTVLDANEIVYIWQSNNFDEETFLKLQKGTHFIDTGLSLREVPEKMRRKNTTVDGEVVSGLEDQG